MEKNTIDFYYKNQKKINELVIFKSNLKLHIVNELVKAGQTLEYLNPLEPRANSQHDGRLVFYVSPKRRNLFFTILYEDLLAEGKTIKLMIELDGGLLEDRSIYKKSIEFTKEEESNFAEHFETTNLTWSHFMLKEYELTVNDIANLSEFIQEKLANDYLLSAFRKIEAFIVKENIGVVKVTI